MAKVLRKLRSCSGFPSPEDQDSENGSSSTSFRRLLSSGRSLTRGPSLNGISPVPSSSDGEVRDPTEKVKNALAMLGTLIDLLNEPVNNKSTIAKRLQDVQTYCQTYIPHLAQIFDKCGGAANGQLPSISRKTSDDGAYQYRELSTILKDVGQLHWVGAFLVIVALVLDRCSKASKRSAKLLAHMKKLRRFGKHVLELHGQEQDSRSSGPSETVQEALRIIVEHAAYCSRGVQETSFFKRCVCADTEHEELVSLAGEIDKLYPELSLNAQLLQFTHNEPSGETFELTEDTVMVGDEKRLGEALQKLESADNATGVRALVLWGMLGTGKSTVGLKLAHEVKRKKNIDKLQCCKILMRGDPDIEVTKKQEELYRKLHKRGVKKEFSDYLEGRRELQNLLRTQRQAEPVLLLFDDADSIHDLERVLPDNLDTALPPGSILLVTTTNSGIISILEDKGVDCRSYEVNVLGTEESQALFLKKIFGDHDVLPGSPVAGHLMQSEPFPKLLGLCGGVPLAINVVGSSIWSSGKSFLRTCFPSSSLRDLQFQFETAYGELDRDRQEKFLRKLTTSMRHASKALSEGDPIKTDRCPLNRSLVFAYGQLNSYARIREVFLDIVAVHRGRNWSDVELFCGADDLATLKQLSMVKRLLCKGGTSGAIVQVHDLLIGVSRKLEHAESQGVRVVVENVDRLPECFRDDRGWNVYSQVEVLKVDHSKEVFTAEQLGRLTNLRYLELHGTTIQGKCKTVPPRLTYYKSRHSSLPFARHDLQTQSLVVLDIDFRMDATSDFDVIQWMPNLQKLKVENSWSLKRLAPPRLKKLTSVVILNCPNFQSLEGLDPATVEHLEIVNCPKFRDFSSVSKLQRLGRLSLAGFECQPPNLPTRKPTEFTKFSKEPTTEFIQFPEEFVIPSAVQILDLSRNSNLKELPRFAHDNRIKKLNLRSCPALKQLGGEMNHLTRLEYLDLGGCSGLEHVPSLLGHHPMLKVLDVQGCGQLHRSELQQSVEFMRVQNPDFRLIDLHLTDEEDGPRGCSGLQRCVQQSYRKTRSLFEKASSSLFVKVVPRPRFRSSTFPRRSRPQYR